MQISVFAVRYSNGVWKEYQHHCSKEEVKAVVDSASAKAFERFRYRTPHYVDFLAGASYVFNVARGPDDKPSEGATVVFGVQVDGTIVRNTMDHEHLLARRLD